MVIENNNLPNNPQINTENLQPFKKFIMTIGVLPSSYLESLTYQELLLWFCNYLQNTVIPTVNNNAKAVEELQNLYVELKDYVDNYFNNLDVQEIINNKLDEMTMSGELQNIIYNYTKITRTYETTLEMIEDKNNLAVGQKIQTLGYNSVNDGGNSLYYISNTLDNNFYQIKLNDNLYANLIYNNKINVKQFGAYGDGIHDDTNSFKNAIAYLKSKFSLNNIYINLLTLDIPNGKYIISDTIEIPVIIKLNLLGDVYILSNVENAPTVWINSGNYEKTDEGANTIRQQSFEISDVIGGNGILSIEKNNPNNWVEDVNNLIKSSIAIEIGDRIYNSNYINCARGTYKNISIAGFSTGIKLNSINTYLLTFENIRLERNRINFQYGDNSTNLENSGENIIFNKVIFSQSYNSFINYKSAQFTFNNCSFDFNGNIILCNSSAHYIFNSCHFENVGFNQAGIIEGNENNCIGYGTIIYNNYNSSSSTNLTVVEMNSPNFYLGSSSKILIPRFQSIFEGNYPNLIINFNNLQYFIEAGYTYKNVFMNTENVKINHFTTSLKEGIMPTIPFNSLDNEGMLNNINNNLVSLESLKNNYSYETQNIDSVTIDTNNKVFSKSLKFVINNKNYVNIIRRIKNSGGNKLSGVLWFKSNLTGDSEVWNHFIFTITIKFFNKNNILINDSVVLYPDKRAIVKDENSDWNILRPFICDIPSNTDEISIAYGFTNKNDNENTILASGNIWIGGIVTNLYC